MTDVDPFEAGSGQRKQTNSLSIYSEPIKIVTCASCVAIIWSGLYQRLHLMPRKPDMMLKENSLFLSHRLPTVWLGSESLRVWSTSTQHIETEWALERMAIYHNITAWLFYMVLVSGSSYYTYYMYMHE